jgi:hypothetical protein
MVNQLSSHRLGPRDDLGPAVESLRGASAGEVFVAGDAGYDGALARGWLIGTGRSFGHVLSTAVGRGLAKLLSRLRAVRHPWWELSDYLLTDIGKTRGDTEVEKLRHRPTIRDPYETMSRDIRLPSDS